MGIKGTHHSGSKLSSEKNGYGLKAGMKEIITVKCTWKRTESGENNFSRKGGGHSLIMLFR